MKTNKKLHVKVGDKIKVMSGNQKGLIGVITTVNQKKLIATIDGIVPRIKYAKNPQGGEARKMEVPIGIHISNLMLWDNEQNLSSRIGYKIVDDKKQRYFKKSGNLVNKWCSGYFTSCQLKSLGASSNSNPRKLCGVDISPLFVHLYFHKSNFPSCEIRRSGKQIPLDLVARDFFARKSKCSSQQLYIADVDCHLPSTEQASCAACGSSCRFFPAP